MNKRDDKEQLANEVLSKTVCMKKKFRDFHEKFQEDFLKLKENSIKLLKLIERDNMKKLSKSRTVITEIPSTTVGIKESNKKTINLKRTKSKEVIQMTDSNRQDNNNNNNNNKPEINYYTKFNLKDFKIVLNPKDVKNCKYKIWM